MFVGTIQQGKLVFGPIIKRQLTQWLLGNEGKRAFIDLLKINRTTQQNRYYWVYLSVISDQYGDSENDLHTYFKQAHLPPVFIQVMGKTVETRRSTSKLSKAEMNEYLDRICAETGVPLPDPAQAGYISNYAPIQRKV